MTIRHAVCLAAYSLLVLSSVLAGPLSVTLDTDGEQTQARLSKTLFEWAMNSTDATACSGDCCTAEDAECQGLARNILDGGAERISGEISPCIQKSINFQCEWWISEGEVQMVCETFPETASVVLEDVAFCASQLAGNRF